MMVVVSYDVSTIDPGGQTRLRRVEVRVLSAPRGHQRCHHRGSEDDGSINARISLHCAFSARIGRSSFMFRLKQLRPHLASVGVPKCGVSQWRSRALRQVILGQPRERQLETVT